MFMRLAPFKAPKRYVFKDPDTGYIHEAADRATLVRNIVAYRSQNGLDLIEELPAVLENFWCGLPENFNRGICVKAPPLKRGLVGFIKGGVALLENLFYGEANMVSQEVADERSEQCKGCKYNVFPEKTNFEQQADSIAELCTGGRKSKNHTEIGNCKVCTCPLRAKVFYAGPYDLTDEERKKMREVNCWQVTDERN